MATRVCGLALLLGLLAGAASAAESGHVTKGNLRSTPQEKIAWMSGGIGDEARHEMRRAAAAYSVHLVFRDREGSYLSDIPYTVAQLNGYELYAGVSAGPLLYLKLPPGAYRIAAQLDGVWQNKQVRAGASGVPARLSFVAPEK